MEIFTKENMVRAKNCSHCLQDFHYSKDSLLPQPESDGKSADVGGGGRIGILIDNVRVKNADAHVFEALPAACFGPWAVSTHCFNKLRAG